MLLRNTEELSRFRCFTAEFGKHFYVFSIIDGRLYEPRNFLAKIDVRGINYREASPEEFTSRSDKNVQSIASDYFFTHL